MKGVDQFRVEIIGYDDDVHEKIKFRSETILEAKDVIDAYSIAKSIFKSDSHVIVAIVNTLKASNYRYLDRLEE